MDKTIEELLEIPHIFDDDYYKLESGSIALDFCKDRISYDEMKIRLEKLIKRMVKNEDRT